MREVTTFTAEHAEHSVFDTENVTPVGDGLKAVPLPMCGLCVLCSWL
jgi:hypothetical protein